VNIADIFGYIAAGIGIFMFLPQAIQVYKTKNTKSISLATFLLVGTSSLFWLMYGFLKLAYPVLLVNVVLITLTSYIVVMKKKHG